MKTKINLIVALFASLILGLTACQKTNITDDKNIVPSSFNIDIPTSISSDDGQKAATTDSLGGQEIYRHMRFFIYTGEKSAQVLQQIMETIRERNLSQPMSFSFTSGDDNRVKNVVIVEKGTYNGYTYQYRLTMTDAELESASDAGLAMQVYWDKDPVQGVAVIKFRNLNANSYSLWGDGMALINYSQVPEGDYTQTMTVELSDLPNRVLDRFCIRSMKMKVGKTIDNRIDVWGNSDHPEAWLLVENPKGFSWSFVASADSARNLAVAEVGLPCDTLNISTRNQILNTYSVKNVLTNQYQQWFMNQYGISPDSTSLSKYLHNANAPGYFDQTGFVNAGQAPNGNYGNLNSAINNLTPFNPLEVHQLHIEFNFSSSK